MKRAEMGHKEAGMASFLVTTVLILVISLTIIGFSQVARRNQREALDRQLSSQAFYAAESGINEAVAVVQEKMKTGLPPSKSACPPDMNYPAVNLDGNDVKVTCLLVETQIHSLFYTGINENNPIVAPLTSANGNPIGKVTLTWRNPTGGSSPTSTCSSGLAGLPTRGSWGCGHGILRADIASMPNGGIDYATSGFFYPTKYGGATLDDTTAPTMNGSNDGGQFAGACIDGSDPRCMVSISGLNSPVYYMNFRSIYRDSTVSVTALDIYGNPVEFTGQVMIDSTAKAQDVIRRIQVRIPLKPRDTSTLPAYAIESNDSLIKRFCVEPGYYSDSGSGGTCQ